MAEENVNVENSENTENNTQNQALERQKRVDALLSNKELKDLLIQKLLDGGHMSKGRAPNDTNTERASLSTQNPYYGNWSAFPAQFAFAPFPTPPPWAPFQPHQRLLHRWTIHSLSNCPSKVPQVRRANLIPHVCRAKGRRRRIMWIYWMKENPSS